MRPRPWRSSVSKRSRPSSRLSRWPARTLSQSGDRRESRKRAGPVSATSMGPPGIGFRPTGRSDSKCVSFMLSRIGLGDGPEPPGLGRVRGDARLVCRLGDEAPVVVLSLELAHGRICLAPDRALLRFLPENLIRDPFELLQGAGGEGENVHLALEIRP